MSNARPKKKRGVIVCWLFAIRRSGRLHIAGPFLKRANAEAVYRDNFGPIVRVEVPHG